MSDIQRQELRCTECSRIFRFNLNFDLDGNHVINCPGCGHPHYRVIVNGKITEERYSLRYQTYNATNYYMTSTSTNTSCDTDGIGNTFLRDAWMNSTSTR